MTESGSRFGPAPGAGHHGPMADPDLTPDLIRRARAAGIAPSYRDSHREEVTVSAETLTAILGALGPAAAGTSTGDGQPPTTAPVPEDVTAPQVRERSWGFAIAGLNLNICPRCGPSSSG